MAADTGLRTGRSVREFLKALRDRFTYNPLRNSYAVFGFLWGLPIPLFSLTLDLWISGRGSPWACIAERPIHLAFLLHPLLFSVLFGAMGTVRRRKDERISQLLAELERHVEELAEANGKLKELDHMKAQFMANVTHELKTPLVSIRGYVESICEGRFGPLAEKQRSGLEIALRNVERLQKLIDELLDFERLEAGERTMAFTDFDLVALVQAGLESLRPQIEEKRLAVQNRLPSSLLVHGDRDQIGRVLLNLLSNAVKFCEDGKAVGVDAKVSDNDGAALITVWDCGPGIPTAAHKYLFTRFWQADGSSRRRHGGTGLGLAIVKGILDAHHAPIRLQSEEGVGTRVQFELPLAESVTA